MSDSPPFTRLVAGLPATVPFVAPEAIERATGRRIALRLGANESTFGPSPKAVDAMCAAAARASFYGDPESYELRRALAGLLGVGMEHLVIGCGIDDLLGLIVRAFLDPGETAVTSLGAYPTFNYHVAGYGGRIERVPYREDRNDLDALATAATRADARMVFLANPDNPTGSCYDVDQVIAFEEALPPTCLLLLDEAYCDFTPHDAIPPIDADDTHIIRLRTFSKAHGMAGARIGYAVAAEPTIRAFDKVRLHFGVSLLAQEGALASLGDPDYLNGVVAEVAAGRREYADLGQSLGLPTLPSATNFVAFDTGSPTRARALMEALAARDVFVRMPGAPPLDRLLRVTVGTPAERAAFAEALRTVVAADR